LISVKRRSRKKKSSVAGSTNWTCGRWKKAGGPSLARPSALCHAQELKTLDDKLNPVSLS
jgi:hypothetical protein